MVKKDCVLAIDNGTQSVRAMVFDPRGEMIAVARIPIEPYFSDAPGLAEQHPQVFWDAVCRACRELRETDAMERVAGVAVTTQRGSVINVDAGGVPLRPAILWLDQRRAEGLPPVGGLWGLAFRALGLSDTVASLQAQAEANWIRTRQPEIWSKTHKFLFLSGYLTHRLTGNFYDSTGNQVGYIPFDFKRMRWARGSDWKSKAVPVERRMLPELFPPGSILGNITKEASEDTGIPAGLPLISAASDKACEVIGAGCLEPDCGCLSYGTAATINIPSRRYVEPISLLPPYPAAVPGLYNMEVQIYRGYWLVNWFKQEFGLREQRIADERGIQPETLFDELVSSVPPGSEGLLLQPYWSPGIRYPGPEARGAIIGFNDVHTRAHIYRAILEGLAYALREAMERTVKRSGVKLTELRVAGGGSQSDAAMQITADIFGLPASRPHVYEASGLGAAVDAAVGLGIHPDFKTAVAEMTHRGDTFEPDPKTHAVYEKLYREVYLGMYRQLQPLYRKILSITRF